MANETLRPGRANQKRRTRCALIEAAVDLARAGKTPSVAETAEQAGISRATAYRYFPTQEALTIDVALEVIAPAMDRFSAELEHVAQGGAAENAADRAALVASSLEDTFWKGEAQVRMHLRATMDLWLASKKDRGVTLRRQGRRMPMIDAALEPLEGQLAEADLQRLRAALAIVVGMESMISLTDVVGISNRQQVSDVRRWMVRALVEAALAEAGLSPS